MAAVGAMSLGGGGGGGQMNEAMWHYSEMKRKQEAGELSPRTSQEVSRMTREKTAGNLSPRTSKNFGLYLKKDAERKAQDDEAVKNVDDMYERRGVDMTHVIAYAQLINFDRGVRRRNLFNLFLVALSLVTFMAEIWMAYNEEKCWAGWPPSGTQVAYAPDGSVVSLPLINPKTLQEYTVNDIDYRVKDCLTQTPNTRRTKMIISAITALLALSIADYYRNQLRCERRSWFIHDSAIWRQNIKTSFLLEMLIILPHPVPLPEVIEGIYDDKLGAIMFLRIYLLIRVLRDHSPIYRARGRLLKDMTLKRSGAVEFNWLLAIKFLFADHMWAFVITGVVLTWFTMAYLIWIFEREHNINFDLQTSVWMVVITMTTVGYGDVTPKYGISQVLTGIAALLGIINTALLTYIVMINLTLSPQDTRIENLLIKMNCSEEIKVVAANYIMRAFRFYRDKVAAGDIKSRAMKKAFKNWNVDNSVFKSHLRSLRRDINMTSELNDMVIAKLESKIPQMTEDISSLLGEKLGLPPMQQGKGNNSLGLLGALATRLEGIETEQKVTLQEIETISKIYEGKKWW